jgi:hypothetical protein
VEQVRHLFDAGHADDEIAKQLQCSVATVYLKRRAGGMLRSAEPRATRHVRTRFEPKALAEKAATMPPVTHAALTEKRTLYPSTVVPVDGLLNVLVSGKNHWKIGDRIAKGKWLGFPIYTLTLEERATCPVSCAHWRSCYGNHMNWAKRVAHGPAFEDRLEHELAILQYRHPGGFAVRLHVLGDFYSVGYVEKWSRWLDSFPALHVFGFSARWSAGDEIGGALIALVERRWDRFAIRFSNAPVDECSTVSIEHPFQKPDDAVVCPQQTGDTASCGSCGLCWNSRKRVAFLRH